MSDRHTFVLSDDQFNTLSLALQDRVNYLRGFGPDADLGEFISEAERLLGTLRAQWGPQYARSQHPQRRTPGTIRVRRTWTFTVDTSAWSYEYGVSPAQVRADFNGMCDQFDAAECFTSAWPGLVTDVHVHSA